MKIKEIYKKSKEHLYEIFGKTFFHDVISIVLLAFSLLIVMALFLVIAFRVKPTGYLIPLVYNSTYGVTALGRWFKIYFYPIAYTGFLLLNLLVAWAYFEKERLITYMVLFVNILIGFLLFSIEFNLTSLIRG